MRTSLKMENVELKKENAELQRKDRVTEMLWDKCKIIYRDSIIHDQSNGRNTREYIEREMDKAITAHNNWVELASGRIPPLPEFQQGGAH